jgi:hypothetical protein
MVDEILQCRDDRVLVRAGDELFAEAYGLVSVDGLVHRVIMSQRQQVEIVRRLAERGDRRQVDWSPADTSSSCRTGSNGQWRTAT